MENKHTELPWIYKDRLISQPVSNHALSVAECHGRFEEAKANAEFICRAVNNHYQLVNALKILLHYHDSGYVNPAALIDVILPKAKQAITAATE